MVTTTFPVLQSFEKDQTKIIFTINQLARGLTDVVAGGGTGTVRTKLIAAQTFNVSPSGSDSNNGISAPFLTLQKAYDVLANQYDFGGQNVTIDLADGTYAGLLVTQQWSGGGTLTIIGNITTPSNVIISTSGNCIFVNGCNIPGVFTVKKLKVQSSAGSAIVNSGTGTITVDGVEFGTALAAHMIANITGATIFVNNTAYTISGGALYHGRTNNGGQISVTTRSPLVITLSALPAFGTAFGSGEGCGTTAFSVGQIYQDQNGHTRQTATGTSTNGSAIITALSINASTLLSVGMAVRGTNIPATATIQSINSTSQITMNIAATGANGGLTFEIATGKRYSAIVNGVVNTTGGGANYLPGDTAGTTDGTGIYV